MWITEVENANVHDVLEYALFKVSSQLRKSEFRVLIQHSALKYR